MNTIKDAINKYMNNEISLRNFEDEILICMQTDENPILDDILEDVGFTTKGELTQEDLQDGLITENDLKNKLHKYLLDIE